MNALCYKVIFSKRLGALVAVGENATSQGKSASGAGNRSVEVPLSQGGTAGGYFVGTLKALFTSSVLACMATTHSFAAPAANTLPTGYSVNSGNVAVSTTGANMTIKQNTDKASINWQSFSIGSAASVNIQQNSASSVLLNRVVGNDPSQIFGKLTANGQVILINPNGIVFGKGGSVTASAFTASTFGMSEEDFKNGKYKFNRNGSKAGITVEQGASINTTVPGGYVALISATVNNQGTINTKQGPVILAAGESVALPSTLTDNVGIPLSSKVRLELAPSTINASVENGGTITTDGGQVLMQAAAVADAVASVTHIGTIDTSGAQGGAVTLLAEGGHIKASGSITANSADAHNKGGDIIIGRDEVTGELAAVTDVSGEHLESKGGFVETSGHQLTVENTQVKTNTWLLDPDNIQITDGTLDTANGYTSKVSASALGLALSAGTSVTINTTLGLSASPPNPTNLTQSGQGSGGSNAAGNIYINTAVSKTGNNEATLTLVADNGIIMSSAIGVTSGTGKLNLDFTAKGAPAGTTPTAVNTSSLGIIIGSVGTMDLKGGSLTLTGTSYKNGGVGVMFQPTSFTSTATVKDWVQTLNITAGNITVNGTANTFTGSSGKGVLMMRGPNPVQLTASGNISINGTVNGTGTGSGFESWWNGNNNLSHSITAGGTLTLRSNNRASNTNTAAAINVEGGLQLKSVGNLVVQAETNNASANAMNFSSNLSSGVQANTSFQSVDSSGKASGNVLIQSNTGRINFSNNLAEASSSKVIKGVNITIDNTGAGMATGAGTLAGTGGTTGATIGDGRYITDSTTGDITVIKGAGKSSASQGVLINDSRSITATKNLNIIGASSSIGVQTGTAALSGGAVNIDGTSDSHMGVYMPSLGGTLRSTAGDVTISASSAAASQSAVNLVNAITAEKNISITGTNTNSTNTIAAVYVNAPVTATLGTIGITADTAGTSNQTLNLTSEAKLKTTDQNIKLTADNMTLASSINAGAGKVTLQTKGTGSTSSAIKQSAAITADGLELIGTSTDFTLNNANNAVNTIAANAKSVSYTNSQALTVGQVNDTPGITTTGNTSLTTTFGDLTLKKAINANAATVTLNAAAAVVRDASLTTDNIIANTLNINAGSNIGSSAYRIKTKVANLSMKSTNQEGGSQYVTEADAVTLAAKTTNGSVNVETVDGTLTVGTVNGITGVTAQGAGTGAVDLTGVSQGANGTGLVISANVTAAEDVHLTGKSSANNRTGFPYAGITNFTTVQGKNIMLDGQAKDTGADVLGYFGAGGSLVATNNITASGSSAGKGVGFYMYDGSMSAGSGMQITGNSALDSGVAFDKSVTITNGSSGALKINGSANTPGKAAINLNGVSITNSGAGGMHLTATQGDIKAIKTTISLPLQPWASADNILTNHAGEIRLTAGTASTDAAGIDGTYLAITQKANANVTLQTKGMGNVTVPKITKDGTGTGDIILSAGSDRAAGDGGQIKTVDGNTVTNNGKGKTYIYTGNASDTGKLENLMGSLATLYLSKVGDNAQNAQLNTAYPNSVVASSNTIPNGAAAQVMFRENTKFDEIQINPATLTMNAGQVDPSTASFAAAVAAANTNGAALTKASITANKFKISTDAAGIAGTLPTPSNQARTTGTYDYATTSSIANKVSSTSAAPAAKLVVQASSVIPVPAPVVPTSNPTRVKVPVGSANPFALASAESLVDDVCSANSLENCHCEESSVNEGVNICYEPHAGSK